MHCTNGAVSPPRVVFLPPPPLPSPLSSATPGLLIVVSCRHGAADVTSGHAGNDTTAPQWPPAANWANDATHIHNTYAFIFIHLFPANLGDSACILEIVQAISAFRQFGDRSGMIRQPQCRNWLHFYRNACRLSKIGRKKVWTYACTLQGSHARIKANTRNA